MLCTCVPASRILLKQMATSSGFLLTSLAMVSTTVCTVSLTVGSRNIRVLFRLAMRKRFAWQQGSRGQARGQGQALRARFGSRSRASGGSAPTRRDLHRMQC